MEFPTNLQDEIDRVFMIHFPPNRMDLRVGLQTYDLDLCRSFLYNFITGTHGHFNRSTLLHVPHQQVPFVRADWPPMLSQILTTNKEITIVTDGVVHPPRDHWIRAGERKVEGVFPDPHVSFCVNRYHDRLIPGRKKRGAYLLDEYYAELKDGVAPDGYHLQYRIFKITFSSPETCWNYDKSGNFLYLPEPIVGIPPQPFPE